MTDPIHARLDVAIAACRDAGALALEYFQNRDSLELEQKVTPQDAVSRADRDVETLLIERIRLAFPQDAVLGEEGGASPGTSGFLWVIDPIDGTSAFLAGLPHWCIVLAVVQGSDTVAGVTLHPLASELFTAVRGEGAMLNGVPLQCDPDLRIETSLVAVGASHRTDPDHVGAVVSRLLRAGGMFYRNGSGALMLASVAAGRLGGYYEPHMNPWDCLAGVLMVEEAGGRALPVTPNPAGGVVLATAPGLFQPLVEIVGLKP